MLIFFPGSLGNSSISYLRAFVARCSPSSIRSPRQLIYITGLAQCIAFAVSPSPVRRDLFHLTCEEGNPETTHPIRSDGLESLKGKYGTGSSEVVSMRSGFSNSETATLLNVSSRYP